jgi:NodT family efflux transporter outer membrane factor (OMF) lipoprotein
VRSPRLAWLGTSLLLGCNVGPRYEPPAVAAPAGYLEAAVATSPSAQPGTWQPARPEDAALKGKWWETFDEPELDALEERLDVGNQNIAQAFQSFMAARAQVGEARAGAWPTVTLDPSYERITAGSRAFAGGATAGRAGTTTNAPSSGATVVNTFSVPLTASWEPDLWGRVANTVREMQNAAQVSAADLENTRLSEQASLAEFYFELRGQDSLEDVYERTIAADRTSLELTRALAATGIDSDQAVAQAEVTLENAEEAGIGLATNRALFQHAIATLIGTPASAFAMPVKGLTTPVPPIPVGVPSQILQRRPDVAAAERAMAQANALIGVGKAAYYPTFDLTASVGFQSSTLGTLFSLPALVWSLGASASETIFDAGLRNATVAQYTAAYRSAVASYRQTVLTAFQQVEDAIATLRVVSQQIVRQDAAVVSAQRNLKIATAQYETGVEPYLDVMVAQTTLLGDEETQVTLRVTAMTAAVQLVQALGGGWDPHRLPTAADVTSDDAARRLSHSPARP